MGYLCANFGLPRSLSLFSIRPDVRDRQMSSDVRQTDVRQYHCLMPPPRGRRGHNKHTKKAVREQVHKNTMYTDAVINYNAKQYIWLLLMCVFGYFIVFR